MFINSFLLCYTIGIEPLGVQRGGKIWEDQKVERIENGQKNKSLK